MPTRSQKIRLGIFVVIGSIIFIAMIAFFTSEKYLQKTDTYYIAYNDVSVSGLEVGSPVKYLGVKVGSIANITIDPEEVGRIIVKMELENGTPIKNDARADIASIGITGLKMIEIRGGSNEAPLLKEEEYLTPGSSITEEITGKAEVIAEKLELILNNLQDFTRPENLEKIAALIEQASSTFNKLNGILAENRQGMRETVLAARSISSRLDATSLLLQASLEKINRIIQSDTLDQILSSTREVSLRLKEANLGELITELGEIADRTNRLLIQLDRDMEQGSVDFRISMRELKSTLQHLNQASRLIQEDPSVLIRGTEIKNAPDQYLERK